MKVIIAEKPSVAKNIADALQIKKKCDGYFEGEDYLITWAFGHLLELYDAKDYDEKMKKWQLDYFPFIPEHFQYKVKENKLKKQVDQGAKKQLECIKVLMNRQDVDAVISACDYDREGQIIADIIFKYLQIKKPIYRMLLNEWTEKEVLKGIEEMVSNTQLRPLRDAGISRQHADWLIGINLTSVATLKYGKRGQVLNIGRVLLPTLKIIYDRDKEIENFKSSKYYKLIAKFKTDQSQEFEGTYHEKDAEDKYNEKFEGKAYLENIKELITNQPGIIIEKQIEKKKEYPPLLFNLSNLQGYITSKYKGWTSDKVLKVAQALYEKKYITYPRTGSMALEESLKPRTKKVLDLLKVGLPYENQIQFTDHKRIFDNAKVESHSAITPTYIIPKRLSAEEEVVYQAIKNRFIMQFMPVAEFEETKIVTQIQKSEVKGIFISKGKIQITQGWLIVEKNDSKDTLLPSVQERDVVDVINLDLNEITRKPPKFHTEKTLLRIMETCGKGLKDGEETQEMMASILSGFSIGTPATRAETIKKLKDTGYITTKGKSLTCTPLGSLLVETFPVKEILDLEYTGKLEKTLSDIGKGKVKKTDFLQMIKEFTIQAVETLKKDANLVNNEKDLSNQQKVGDCPLCGNPVVETEKAFGCSNWKNGCKYTIWKDDRFINALGKSVTRPMVEILLKNGKVGFKNLKSKKGNTYSAYLRYVKNEQTGYLNWEVELI